MVESDHDDQSTEPPVRDGAHVYAIRVEGRLSPRDVERLGGLVVDAIADDGDACTTTLRGRLADQSALIGALNTLHAWQIPVLEVTSAAGHHPTA